MEKTHFKKLRNPSYIGSYELMINDKESRELVVTIGKVSNETVTVLDKSEVCMVMQLVGQKPMILNATNAKAIAKMYGAFVEDWAGKPITLYVAKIRAFGDTHDALRIRATKPANSELPKLLTSHKQWDSIVLAVACGDRTIEQLKEKFTISIEIEKLLTPKTPPIDAV
jgi:hypothetical protein